MPLDQSHPVEVEGIYNLWDFDVDAGYNFRNKKTGKKNLRSAILVELGEVPPPSGGAPVGRQHRRPSSHHRRFSFVGFTTPAAASPSFRLQLHRGIIGSEAPTSSLPPQPRPLWNRRCQYLKKKMMVTKTRLHWRADAPSAFSGQWKSCIFTSEWTTAC